MSRQWTPEQRHCIDARGGTVLVSAAAGSGKTTVLVERVIRRITDEQHPVDADRLLVVTFTKAAAAEMKQRLGKALAEQMAAHPHDRRLQRQQMLLPRAHISTVHSFCSALLRENFHLLDISPQFKVAEDADVRTMQQEALAEVMEAAYEARDPAFLALAELLSGGRDDRKLTEAVLRLYTFIQSHPFPNDWLQAQEALYATNAPIANTAWGQTVRRYVSGTLHHGVAMLRKAWSMATSEEQMAAAYAGPLLADCQQLEILADNFDTEDNWDDAIDMLEQFTFNRLGSLRQYPDELFKKRVTGLRDEVKKQLAALPALFCGSEAECREDIAVLRQPVTALCALVRQFSDTYEQKKAAKHWVDFNDLEHLTLRLKTAPCAAPRWHRSWHSSLKRCWWTNIRTPTPRRMRCSARSRGMSKTCLWWAMSNRASTAFARRCRIFSSRGKRRMPIMTASIFRRPSRWGTISAAATP